MPFEYRCTKAAHKASLGTLRSRLACSFPTVAIRAAWGSLGVSPASSGSPFPSGQTCCFCLCHTKRHSFGQLETRELLLHIAGGQQVKAAAQRLRRLCPCPAGLLQPRPISLPPLSCCRSSGSYFKLVITLYHPLFFFFFSSVADTVRNCPKVTTCLCGHAVIWA